MVYQEMMFEEKRESRRFSGKIGIYTKDLHGLNFGFIRDLSRHGAYIETQKIAPLGSSFYFVMSNGTITAPVGACVIRSRDSFFEGGRSGLAVEFSDLGNLSKRLRDDLLLYLMNQEYQDMWKVAS